MNILEGEVESNETLLKYIESRYGNDSEDYEFSNGYQMDILRWMEDIKKGNSKVLTNDDLEFRMDILNNQIECHEDVIENDDTLTNPDIKDIKQNIKKIGEWKRELRRLKKASI